MGTSGFYRSRSDVRAAVLRARASMVLLFSNGLGCLPSLLLSIGVTVVLLLVFGVL